MNCVCRPILLVLAAAMCVVAWSAAADRRGPQPMVDVASMPFQVSEFTRDNKKVPAGTAEPVEGQSSGKAVKLTFVDGAAGGFMAARLRPTPAWDASAGFSFWVKGDGSPHWGGIELIDRDDFSLRYGYCFPINANDWTKVTVPWRDVIPELAGPLMAAGPAAPAGGYAPSRFGNFWFGKWHYWRDYPAESFAVDRIELEPTIELPPTPEPPASSEPLARVRAKLARHGPITLVTMGDSLTDEHHWSNREVVWHKLLAQALKARFGSDVRVVNPAIGGTTLSQNMVLMPRWSIEAPAPDLVTVWFGGNDWDTGVRGPRFAEYLRLCVDRIRRQTRGSADVLLLTTNPTHDRWDTMNELADAVRTVAREKRTGLADIAAVVHQRFATADDAVKQEYLAWDKTHLGPKGHEIVRDSVLKSLEADHP